MTLRICLMIWYVHSASMFSLAAEIDSHLCGEYVRTFVAILEANGESFWIITK